MSTAVASPPTEAQLWTVDDVCRFLHCGRSTLSLWIEQGRVPEGRRVGRRRLLWDPQTIRSLVMSQGS